jgi:TOTE conflict system primase-like protein
MPGSECCAHCAEIPLLRDEVAALRARLNALTTLPLSASGPLPLQAELDVAAKTPPRQMPLFGPVHGPPLPQVDHQSSLQAKVGLYQALFAGRSDVYAYRWENTAEGTKGWAPKRRPGTTRDNPEYLPLTDDVITAHLTKDNPAACGLYVIHADRRRDPADESGSCARWR